MAAAGIKDRSQATSWRAKLGLVLLSIAFTCVLLEVALRVYDRVRRRGASSAAAASTPQGESWAAYDPDLGYRGNPKWQDLNPDGLRDHPVGPKNGRTRLLFLGDSLAFYGDDLDDTFVGHLRKALHKTPGHQDLDVINAGMRGYTNYQELLYLKKYGLAFEPDFVGVQFCLNDLHKFLHSFRVEDGKIVSGSYRFSSEVLDAAPRAPRTLLQRVADRSRLLSDLKDRMQIAAKVIAWKATRGFSFDYKIDVWTAWQDEPWNDIERQFREMRALGDRRGFKIFVVAVPLAVQYDGAYLGQNREYVLKPQRKLEEICERLGIPLLDLYPEMNTNLFAGDGLHLTKEGRALVGQRIAAFMFAAHLLPSGERAGPLAASGPLKTTLSQD